MTQESNWSLLHWQAGSLPLCRLGSIGDNLAQTTEGGSERAVQLFMILSISHLIPVPSGPQWEVRAHFNHSGSHYSPKLSHPMRRKGWVQSSPDPGRVLPACPDRRWTGI